MANKKRWTVERRRKFSATMAAKRNGSAKPNGNGNGHANEAESIAALKKEFSMDSEVRTIAEVLQGYNSLEDEAREYVRARIA
jgi:hypothetical protein